MKYILILSITLALFLGCSNEASQPLPSKKKPLPTMIDKEYIYIENKVQNNTLAMDKKITTVKEKKLSKIMFKSLPKTYLVKSDFEELPNWHEENYEEALNNFINNCKSTKTKKIYKQTCKDAKHASSAKHFIQQKFSPYKINTKSGKDTGLLTGYYEPELRGSLKKTLKYKYPIHETPKDLIMVDLSSIYPHLKNYRLRGKINGNKLIPYHTRKESSSQHIPANVICYTDSKIDLFFLEIQGSGRVTLEDGRVMYIGYDNQNGHRYRAIGKYLVKIGALKLSKVSLQSIRKWLDENPKRVNEVLHYNKSVVYFKQRENAASGSLGLRLTATRSIAVDRRYIPLGSMLYLNADIKKEQVSRIVLAQDTGGAIKGAIRADMFLGFGDKARDTAGELKSALELWILLPKNKRDNV